MTTRTGVIGGGTLRRRGLLAGSAALAAAVAASLTDVRAVLAAPFEATSTDATPALTGSTTGTQSGATGVYGLASATLFNSAGATIGVRGRSMSSHAGAIGTLGEIVSGDGQGTGVKGTAGHGVGVVGTSNNNIGVYGASSQNVGVFGDADNNTAVMGRTGAGIGVYGTATNPGGGGRAAVFDGTVLVNGPFTVVGGAKSAGVRHPDGSVRRMYCQEGTEAYFEDLGGATLTAGRAVIDLDPDFSAVVRGDDYRVFLTPEGDCKGLYVSLKGPNRFVVEELQGGTSSSPFSYRVMARRRDDVGRRMEKVDVRPVPSRNIKTPDLTLPDALRGNGGGGERRGR